MTATKKTTYYAPNGDTRTTHREYTHVIMSDAIGDRELPKGEFFAYSFHMSLKNAEAALKKVIKLGYTESYIAECSTEKPVEKHIDEIHVNHADRPRCDRQRLGKNCGRYAVRQNASGTSFRCALDKTDVHTVRIIVKPESIKPAPSQDTIIGVMVENNIPMAPESVTTEPVCQYGKESCKSQMAPKYWWISKVLCPYHFPYNADSQNAIDAEKAFRKAFPESTTVVEADRAAEELNLSTRFPNVPENILHMIKHANTEKAKSMWRRIADRNYGQKAVDTALAR
jgi:hypothetical protein